MQRLGRKGPSHQLETQAAEPWSLTPQILVRDQVAQVASIETQLRMMIRRRKKRIRTGGGLIPLLRRLRNL